MTNDIKTTSVTLLDQTFQIDCPKESEADLEKAFHELTQRLKEEKIKNANVKEEQIFAIVSLNLMHELLRIKEKEQEATHLLQSKIHKLEDQLELAITEY